MKKEARVDVTSVSLKNLNAFYRILASSGLGGSCCLWMPADGKLSAMSQPPDTTPGRKWWSLTKQLVSQPELLSLKRTKSPFPETYSDFNRSDLLLR